MPVVGSPGSRGGQANEAGSLYRSGVAAYLAAHGLAGRGVEAAGYPENGPPPVSLAFETGDGVDDNGEHPCCPEVRARHRLA